MMKSLQVASWSRCLIMLLDCQLYSLCNVLVFLSTPPSCESQIVFSEVSMSFIGLAVFFKSYFLLYVTLSFKKNARLWHIFEKKKCSSKKRIHLLNSKHVF